MDIQRLIDLGLTTAQANAYVLLVEKGSLSPTELMTKTGESRTNSYMILDKLTKLSLAFKDEKNNKLIYRPKSPAGLLRLAVRQKERAYQYELSVKQGVPELTEYYNKKRIQPDIRFLQGKEALQKVYTDHLNVTGPIKIFRTTADEDYFGEELYAYMDQRAEKGIRAELIAPYSEGADQYSKENDARLKREVVFVDPELYSAPVEITVYGDKVSITSFGEEAVATIIQSTQISQALSQIFDLAKIGAFRTKT